MNEQEAPQTLRQYDERHPLATWQRMEALERKIKELETQMHNRDSFVLKQAKRIHELERALFEHAGQIKHVPDAPKERDV